MYFKKLQGQLFLLYQQITITCKLLNLGMYIHYGAVSIPLMFMCLYIISKTA